MRRLLLTAATLIVMPGSLRAEDLPAAIIRNPFFDAPPPTVVAPPITASPGFNVTVTEAAYRPTIVRPAAPQPLPVPQVIQKVPAVEVTAVEVPVVESPAFEVPVRRLPADRLQALRAAIRVSSPREAYRGSPRVETTDKTASAAEPGRFLPPDDAKPLSAEVNRVAVMRDDAVRQASWVGDGLSVVKPTPDRVRLLKANQHTLHCSLAKFTVGEVTLLSNNPLRDVGLPVKPSAVTSAESGSQNPLRSP